MEQTRFNPSDETLSATGSTPVLASFSLSYETLKNWKQNKTRLAVTYNTAKPKWMFNLVSTNTVSARKMQLRSRSYRSMSQRLCWKTKLGDLFFAKLIHLKSTTMPSNFITVNIFFWCGLWVRCNTFAVLQGVVNITGCRAVGIYRPKTSMERGGIFGWDPYP